MQHIKNLFLDLDGTLTNPKEGITKSIQYALEKMKAPIPTMDELEWCIGPPLIEIFKTLLDTQDNKIANLAVDYYRERYVNYCTIENIPYEGIHQTLEKLSQASLKLYLATSKPWAYAQKILDYFELSRFFTAIHGSELDGTRDYKKDLIAYILEHHKLNFNETVMIGDRSHDVVGAKHNKMLSIGVSYGYGSVDELKSAGADIICHHHHELRKLFVSDSLI